MRKTRVAIAGVVLLGAAFFFGMPQACADRIFFAPVEGFAYHEPSASYEALFPYYVELCVVSQFRSDELGSGGSPGHAHGVTAMIPVLWKLL